MRHHLTCLSAAFLLACVVTPASSASTEEIDALYDAIGTPRLMEIMREEGLEQAGDLRENMFPGRSGWDPVASAIYSTDRMNSFFRAAFDETLTDVDVTPLLEFFRSDLGAEIVGLELSAREALLDDAVEEAAIDAFERLSGTDPDRVAALDGFVEGSDLVNLNVMGAMNASLSFYRGLAEGGGFELSEAEILSDVWDSEPDTRQDAQEWLYAYLAMSYQPLTDAEIIAYTDVTTSPAGKALNRALFTGFDDVFNDISFSLGRAASQFVMGDDI